MVNGSPPGSWLKKAMSETSGKSLDTSPVGTNADTPQKPLTPEAKRALAEAEARREAQKNEDSGPQNAKATELGGRQGPDPVRFGDWENGGIVSDF